jgi:hypothetical protein
MSQPGHCGLCNVPSTFLIASPWGQVCRLCLRAKSRKAVREASVPVPAIVDPQEPRAEPVVVVSIPDSPCGSCGQLLQVVRSPSGARVFWHVDPAGHTACPSSEQGELAREFGTSYHAAGVCALCGRHSPWLVDSEWGRIHEDCGYQRAATEQRAAEQNARTARDEALRAEGVLKERAAVRKELEAVARVLTRREELATSIVAALIDWVDSRNGEGT